MSINEQIEKIPAWKRWIICTILRRKQWKIARAYNIVGCDLLRGSKTWDWGDDILAWGNIKWAELYGLPTPDAPKRVMWKPRAEWAEHQLDWEIARRKQVEEQLELMKRTAKSMRNLRRQKTTPWG